MKKSKYYHAKILLMTALTLLSSLGFWRGDVALAQVNSGTPRDLEELNRLLKGLTSDLQKSKNSQTVKDEIAPLLFPVNKDTQSLLAPQGDGAVSPNPSKAKENSPSAKNAPAKTAAD